MGRDSKLITVLVPLTASGNHYCAWASVSSTDSQSTGIPLQQGWARIHFWKPDFTGMEARPFVSVPCKASFLLQVATDTIWSSMEIFTICPPEVCGPCVLGITNGDLLAPALHRAPSGSLPKATQMPPPSGTLCCQGLGRGGSRQGWSYTVGQWRHLL